MCYFRYCMHAHSHTIKHLQLHTPNCQILRAPALGYLTQSLHNNKNTTSNTGTVSLYGSHNKMTGQCLFAVENGAAFTSKQLLSESVAESTYLFSICVSKQERAEQNEIYPQMHHHTELCRINSTSQRFQTQIYHF